MRQPGDHSREDEEALEGAADGDAKDQEGATAALWGGRSLLGFMVFYWGFIGFDPLVLLFW